jgi:hypothetical protein
MPDVLSAHPEADVEVAPQGLVLKPSTAAVPRTMVGGVRLISG